MKILNADKHKYIPQQQLIEKIKYGNGFVKGGAFYLPEYRGDGFGDVDFKKIINSFAGIVGPVAGAVSSGAKVAKSLTGGGIEADALNDILSVKTGSGFYFVNSEK